MGQALFGAIIYSILGLATSVYVQKIVDYVLVDGNINLLNLMSVIMLAILLLRTFIGSMKSILALKTGQKIDAALILGYYKHLLALPQQFFDTMRVGEIISRINDAVKIRVFINNVSLTLAVNVLMVLCTLSLMFVYSWKLALVVACSVPLFFALYFIFNRFNKRYMRKIMENAAELESQLVESITSVATIKSFGVEDIANVKTETRFVKLLRSTFSGAKGAIYSGNASEMISGLVTISVLWAGSYWTIGKDFTPGTLMSFYALTGYLLSPVIGIVNANQSIQDALIAADRLFQIMDIEQEESQKNKITLTKDMVGDISFQSVNFRYGTRKQVFENFNLLIPVGQTTAIVGESGSGKTTLMALLQNIYPIQHGYIRIGGHNLQHVNNESLRRVVAVVPQQIDLFAGTLLQNIAVGDWQPEVRKATEICTMLGISEMIDQLPAGLNTHVGEHGVSLSGGERQRIAIARALYKEPEILILDEATSALDSASEHFVKHALNRLSEQGKTIIVIAHRLSTIRDAQKIVVLHEGKMVEEGSHADLITRNGFYLKYWNIQTANTHHETI
jgi:ATP-binding cassette subfamily B protein